jgi:hypothetical protein
MPGCGFMAQFRQLRDDLSFYQYLCIRRGHIASRSYRREEARGHLGFLSKGNAAGLTAVLPISGEANYILRNTIYCF